MGHKKLTSEMSRSVSSGSSPRGAASRADQRPDWMKRIYEVADFLSTVGLSRVR